MSITSGTKLRLRYKRPGDTEFKVFRNATTCNWNDSTQGTELHHKDNPGNHSESIPDGHNASSDVSYYHEDQSTYLDLEEARLADEILTLQFTTGVSGQELKEQQAWIAANNRSAQVRQRVTGQLNFTHVGAPILTVVP